MAKKRGYFKGRVIEVKGSIVVIDTKAEKREIKKVKETKEGKKEVVAVQLASWKKPDPMPKVGDIVRCIFRVRNK